MAFTFKALVIPALLASSAGCAADKPVSAGHYVEHTCTFGQYGDVTVHEGGINDIYIVVHGKKYPASGGEDFVQSNGRQNPRRRVCEC